jgi:hypothetical protein
MHAFRHNKRRVVREALVPSGQTRHFQGDAIALEALSETTNGDADRVVMNPTCHSPKIFGVQPTADSAREGSALACTGAASSSSSSQGICVLYRRDPFFLPLDPFFLPLKYYNKIRPVFRLAKANRFLAIDPFDSIDAPATEYHEITIYTAEELERMLAVAEESYSDLVPFLALVSFGFLRSEELIARTTNETVLDWSAFDAEDRQIFVPHAVAKRSKTLTGNERAIPYNDALEHWLKPYIKQSGRIVQREKIAAYRALRKIRHRAQARDLQNGLRHSCLTYWMAANGEESMGTVARWSGNSPAVAKRHYVTAVKRSLGEKWFGIRRDGGEPEPTAPSHGIYTGDSTTLLGRPDKQV